MQDSPRTTPPRQAAFGSALRRVVLLRSGETAPAIASGAYFFCLLAGYYLMRPVREAMGIERGWDDLPWLMTGTLAAMALANPLFAAVVARFPRKVFIPATYRFFALNILLFFVLLVAVPEGRRLYLGYAFYIWLSVYNLFVVAVFWGFMADLFTLEQGRRLFGFIGIGGTLGAIAGAAAASVLVEAIGQAPLLLLAAVFLEIATRIVTWLARGSRHSAARPGPREPGPGALKGLGLIARSPYLLLICVFMLLFAVLSTFLYMEQGRIIASALSDRAARTALFARIDLVVNLLTLITQVFLTGRLIRWLGVTGTLSILPVVTIGGFAALAATPTLAVLVAFQTLRRGLNYGVTRPTREVLYTILGPDEKYKSKSFIDTFVYRTGDLVGAWIPAWLAAAGFAVSWIAVPVAAAWLASALVLGRLHARSTRV